MGKEKAPVCFFAIFLSFFMVRIAWLLTFLNETEALEFFSLRIGEFHNIADVIAVIFEIMFEDQVDDFTFFIGELPFPDVSDTKGITFPLTWFTKLLLELIKKLLVKFLGCIMIFHPDLDDDTRVFANTVGYYALTKTVPVRDHHLLEVVGVFNVRVILNMGTKLDACNLMGHIAAPTRKGKSKEEKEGEGKGYSYFHHRTIFETNEVVDLCFYET